METANLSHFFSFKENHCDERLNLHFDDRLKRQKFSNYYHKNLANIKVVYFYTNEILHWCDTWQQSIRAPHIRHTKQIHHLGKGRLWFFFSQGLLKLQVIWKNALECLQEVKHLLASTSKTVGSWLSLLLKETWKAKKNWACALFCFFKMFKRFMKSWN